MRFYIFTQNNSGGWFDHNPEKGIGYRVAIQALTAEHANAIAQQTGIYFDGIEKGVDCSCCGDRWRPVDETDATEDLKEVRKGWNTPSYIHHINGMVVSRV